MRIVEVAGKFIDTWASKAHALGWTTMEVFGIHRDAPMARYGCMGLVFCLVDPDVTLVSIDTEMGVIRTSAGARKTFT